MVAIGAPTGNSNYGYVNTYNLYPYPVNPVVGQIFYSSSQNKLYIWNGSSWKSISFI